MALINCPECGGLLSDKAAFCPHCGYPFRELRRRRWGVFSAIAKLPCFVVGLVLILMAAFVLLAALDLLPPSKLMPNIVITPPSGGGAGQAF